MFVFTPAFSAMVGLALYTKMVTKECSKTAREALKTSFVSVIQQEGDCHRSVWVLERNGISLLPPLPIVLDVPYTCREKFPGVEPLVLVR